MTLRRILPTLALALAFTFAAAQDVEFGYVSWPGVTVKSHVASEILQTLGYETDMEVLSVPLVLKGVSEGDLDVFLGVWRPSMNAMVEPYLSESGDGTITLTTRNLEPTIYRPGVPTYVAEQGITSLADVAANAEMFDGKIYGIEPGNDGNAVILDMIENDTYGFSSMDLVASSTAGMLSNVERAIDRKEPIVFLAWSPHWMNAAYDITYLDDPQKVWGGDGYVATGVNTTFMAENPNLATFFEQVVVTAGMQDAWINGYSRQGTPAETVARNWIEQNLDTVLEWTRGVTTVDGEPAAEALQEAFN